MFSNCLFLSFLFVTFVSSDENVHTAEEVTPEIADSIVEAHNKIRSNVQPEAANMIKLAYDTELEELAREHSVKCVWEHRPDTSVIGENIWFASPKVDTNSSLIKAVNTWADEVKDYSYNSGQCSAVCGHYTQVVWAETERIGCAVAICPSLEFPKGNPVKDAQFVVCNYKPSGNLVGKKPYINGKTGTECPPGKECLERGNSASKRRTSYGCLVTMIVALVVYVL